MVKIIVAQGSESRVTGQQQLAHGTAAPTLQGVFCKYRATKRRSAHSLSQLMGRPWAL